MLLISNILYDTIYHSIPIILCVIGGSFAYKAGVLNIALEGMMLMGAFMSVYIIWATGNVALGISVAIISSLLLGLIFAVMGVTLKGNVIIVGLAVNMFASAFAGFILKMEKTANFVLSNIDVGKMKIHIPIIKDIPIIGPLFSGHPPIYYITLILIAVMWILMYKTKFGIYTRVIGENEDAAKSLGIKTTLYKYIGILIGSATCSLAGINLAFERLALYTNDMTAGRGFIAIAASTLGNLTPLGILLSSVLFGFVNAISIYISSLNIPSEIIQSIP